MQKYITDQLYFSLSLTVKCETNNVISSVDVVVKFINYCLPYQVIPEPRGSRFYSYTPSFMSSKLSA